ncbi:A-kinase anchor protein 9-like isoform X5 [Lineus longissimus]|uniref:A-kinase anchor protein 9-like isoform X5 n=1 Tax=Lineus longissimus TaxID=88925 RepID=UPI00315C7DA7
MDDEERKKKLQAGKERLAQFQKRKARKKRRKSDTPTAEDGCNRVDSTTLSGTDSADQSVSSDVLSFSYEESDQGSVGISDLSGDDTSNVDISFEAKVELKHAADEITQLEEQLFGKQAAIDDLSQENEKLRGQLSSQSLNGSSTPSGDSALVPDVEEDLQRKVKEYELALAQRDDVLKQLSDSLQTEKQGRNSVEEAYSVQTEQLTQQIHQLQGQMQQLDGLKTEYEQQVETLKQELDKERQLVNATMPAVSAERDDMLARIKTKHEEAISQLRDNLDPAEQQIFDRLRNRMNDAHDEELQYLKNEYADELKSQIDALQATMQNRHSSQLELMKTELEIEKTQHQEAVRSMKGQLDAIKKQSHGMTFEEQDTGKLIESLKGQLLQQHQDMLETTSQQFEEKYLQHIEELKKEYSSKHNSDDGGENWKKDQAANLSQAEALRQDMLDLRSRLQGEFECLLEMKNDYEKEKTASQAKATIEMENMTSRNKLLMDKYERELAELRQQLEAKEKAGGDAQMEDLFTTLRSKLSMAHQKQLRDFGQEFDEKYQRHLEAVKLDSAAKEKGQHHQNGGDVTAVTDTEAMRNELFEINSRLQGEYDILLDLKSEMLTSQSGATTDSPLTNGSQALLEKYEKEIADLKSELEKAQFADNAKSQEHARELQDQENEYKKKIDALEDNLEDIRSREHIQLAVNPPVPALTVTPSSDVESSPEGSPHKVGEKYVKELEEKVKDLEEQLENLRTFSEAEHQAHVEELRIDYESRSELEIEKARLDMEDAHAKEIEEIEAKYGKIIEEFPAEFEKVKSEMASAHATEIEELEANYQKEIETYQQQVVKHVEDEVKTEWQRVELEMKATLTAKDAELQKLKLVSEQENETKLTLDAKDKELETLKTELEAVLASKVEELENADKEHKEMVNGLQKQHDEALGALRKKLDEKLADEKEDERALESLQKEHEEAMEALRQELTDEFEQKTKALQQTSAETDADDKGDEDALEALRNEHEDELDELRQELLGEMERRLTEKEYETEAMMAEKYEDDISELQATIRDQTAEIEKLLEDHNTNLENLKFNHQQELITVREDLKHDLQKEAETLKSEFDVQMQVELTNQKALLKDEYGATIEKLREENEEVLKEKDDEIRKLEKIVAEADVQTSGDGDRSAELEEQLTIKEEEIARLREEKEGLESEASNLKDMDSSIVAYENRLAEKENELSEKDTEIGELRKLNIELEMLKSAFGDIGDSRSALDMDVSTVSSVGKPVLDRELDQLRVEYEERLNERDVMIKQLQEMLEALENGDQKSQDQAKETENWGDVIVKPECAIMDEVVTNSASDGAVLGEVMQERHISVHTGVDDPDEDGAMGHDSSGEGQTGLGFVEGDSIEFDKTTDCDSGLMGTGSTFEVTGSIDFPQNHAGGSNQHDIDNLTLMHQSEMETMRSQYEDRCTRLAREYKEQLEKLQNESQVEELTQKITELQKQIEEKHQAEADDFKGLVEKMESLEGDGTKESRDGEEKEEDEEEKTDEVDFTVKSARVQELQDELEKLREELEDMEAKLEWSKTEEKTLQTLIEELRDESREDKYELEKLQGDLQEREEELDRMRAENDKSDLMIEKLREEVQNHKNDMDRFQNTEERLDELIEECRSLRDEVNAKELEIESLVLEKQGLEKESDEIEALESKLKDTEAELEASKNELDEYRKELETLRQCHREEVEQYESNIRMLEQQYDVKMVEEDYNDKVRALEKNYAERVDTIRKELRENYGMETEKMTQKHQQEMQNLEQAINDQEQTIHDQGQKIETLQAELEENQAIQTSDLEGVKQALEKQYEDQLSSGIATSMDKEQNKFLEEHQQMVKKFAEDKEVEISELKAKFADDKAELEKGHEKKLSELKQEHTKELEDLRASLEQAAPGDDVELEKLKQQHQQEIENIRMKLQEESLVEQRKKLEEMTTEMEASRNEEVDQIKERMTQEHHAELERFRNALDNKEDDLQERIRELEQKHVEELQAAKEESKKRIDEELARLLEAHQHEIRAITLDNEREKSDLEEAHCQEIIDLRERLKHSHLHAIDEIEQHYKDEFEELEKHHTEEMAKMKEANDDEKDRLRRQLENKFQETIGVLQQEMDGHRVEMDSQREVVQLTARKVEKQRKEASKFHINMAALRDYVEQCMGIEELITKKMAKIVRSQLRKSPTQGMNGKGPEESEATHTDDTPNDMSMASVASEEMSLSQHLCESLFVTPGMEDEEKQMLTDSSSKLQSAVEKLLDMVASTTEQLQESQKIQQRLLEDINEKEHDLRRAQDQLEEEKEQKNYLAEELHRTEGALGNVTGEKAELEDGLHQVVQDRNVMDHDLETTRNRLQEFVDSEAEFNAKKDELDRQRLALEEKVPGEQKGLLVENQRLSAEKRDQQRQYEKDREEYAKRIMELEMTVEELQIQNDRLDDDKSANAEDLLLQIEAMEERLRSNKQFLEQQTAEREQEREEYQREIERLQVKIKEKSKDQKVESRLQRELDDALEQLRDKTDQHSEALLKKEQFERDLQQLGQEKAVIDETLCHLEAELGVKNKTEEVLNSKIAALELELSKQHVITEELVQSREQESMSKKDYEVIISDLRAELDSKSRAEQLVLKQKMELEQELDKMRQLEEELATDRDAFQAKVNEQLILISNLKSSLDQLRCSSESDSAKADMQRALDAEKEVLERKDKELGDLVDQVEKYRSDLMEKDNNCMHLQLQIETGAKELEYLSRKHHEQLDEAKKKNEELESEVQRLKDEVDNQGITPIAQLMLDSKNDEIEILNEQVTSLEKQIDEVHDAEEVKQRSDQLMKDLEEKVNQLEELEKELFGVKLEMASLMENQDLARHLEAELQVKDEKLEELKKEIDEKEEQRNKVQMELDLHRTDEANQVNLLVAEKENSIEQLTSQIETLNAEVKNLTEFQQSFQDDYDTIQTMLEEKQAEVEGLSHELMETRPPIDGASIETQDKFEKEVASLKKDLKEKQNIIDEKEEELYELKEQTEAQEEKAKETNSQLCEKSKIIDEWKQRVDEFEQEVKSKDDEIDKLNGLLADRDDEISLLSRDVSNKENEIVRLLRQTPEGDSSDSKILSEFKNKVEEQRKTIQDLRDQLHALKDTIRAKQLEMDKISSVGTEYKELLKEQEANHESELDLVRREKDSKIHYLEEQLADAKKDAGVYKSTTESLSNLDEKVEELQKELEAQHKLDLEKQEVKVKLEADVALQELQLKYSEDIAKLKEQHNLEVANLTAQIRDDFDKKYANDVNLLRQQHERDLYALRKTIDDNGSLTDIAKQLNAELAQAERLDTSLFAQFGRKRQEGVGQENSSQLEGFSSADSSGVDQQNDDSNIPDRLQVLLSRLHNEGVQVLTLSELQFIQQHRIQSPVDKAVDVGSLQQAWENEKQSLMEAVQALKDLLARTQHSRTPDKKSQERLSDWRADLVKAINFVFTKERESLLAELRTQVVSHPEEEVSVYNSLERKLKEQESKHESAMEQIFCADRQSLLAEIRDLRAHMNVIRIETQEEKQRHASNISSSEEVASKKERQLKSQLDLLDYKLKQEKVLVEDLRSSLDSEKSRTIEISSQLGREKNRCTDLQADIGNLQSKLTNTEEQLSREKARLNTCLIICEDVLTSLEDERTKSNHLREALEIEQKNCEQYREEAQKARKKNDMAKERELHVMEKWKRELDSEKQQKMDALKGLEDQRRVVADLQRSLETERHLVNRNEKEANAKLNELKSTLDMERAKCDEINSALLRERTLRAEVRESLELERNNTLSKSQQSQSTLNDLQSRLDLEKSKYLDIASALEREQKKVTTLNVALEGDRSQYLVDLEHERAVCRQLKNNIDAIESQRQEVARQLEFEKDRAYKLQADCDRQRAELLRGHETEQEVENQREAERFKERQQRKSLEMELEKERQKSLELEIMTKELRQRCAELEFQLAERQREVIQVNQQHELEKMRRLQSSPDQDRAELEHALKMHEKELEVEQLTTKTADLEEQLANIEKQLFESQSQRPSSPAKSEQDQIIKDQALRLHEKDSEVRIQRKKIADLEQNISQRRHQMEEMSEELQDSRKQALTSTPMHLERDRNDLRQTLKLQEKEIEVDALTSRIQSLEQQLNEAERHVLDLEQVREAERKQQHEKGIELKKVQHKLVSLEARLAREERPGSEDRTSELVKEMLNKDDEIQKLKFKVIELEGMVAKQQADTKDLEQKVEREKQRKQKMAQKAEAKEQEIMQRLHAAENETAELRQKVVELGLKSSANDRQSVRPPRHVDASKYASPMQRFELSMEREDYVLPEQRTNVFSSRTEGGALTPTFSQRSGPSTSDALGHLELLRQKLHMLVLKHKEEVSKTKHRLADDGSHRSAGNTPEMLVLSKTLDNILTELQNLQASLSSDSGVTDISRALSPSQLHEKMLHQNEELLHFVARISQEKQELRDTLANLEEEIWRYRQREASMTMAFKPRSSESSVADSLLTTERAQWSRERAQLSLALHNSERELHALKKDVRQKEIESEIEREHRSTMFTSPSAAAQPDQEKMQRLYGHYLRAESYRKNLVYQKKYLLSLIGGFRDTEVETLQMLAKMGAYPSDRDVRRRSRHSRAMTKFRGAVRAVIALSRLRYLMKKWKRVKRVGSAVVAGSLPTTSTLYIPNSSSYFPSRASTTHSIGSASPVLESGRVHVTPAPPRADYSSPRQTHFTSPPTRDENHSRHYSHTKSTPEYGHRPIYPGAESVSSHHTPSRSGEPGREDRSLDQFIQKLEHLQQKLGSSQDIFDWRLRSTCSSYLTTGYRYDSKSHVGVLLLFLLCSLCYLGVSAYSL